MGWLRGFGPIALVGVEGTGSYGVGLARHLRVEGVAVVEIDRPNRAKRRQKGKSDTLDAISAARVAHSGDATGQAKTRDGNVEGIRVLRLARVSALKARTQALNQLRSLICTASEDLGDRLRDLSVAELAAFARLCGAAPIPATSGKTQDRHRLHRGGDRQANSALLHTALTRMNSDPSTRAYVERRTNQGLSKREIMRCLKRSSPESSSQTYPTKSSLDTPRSIIRCGWLRLPDGVVVGEVDQAGIELLEAIHPLRRRSERTLMTVSVGCLGEHVGGILAGRVVTLSSNDDDTVGSTCDKRLVSVGVPWRWDQEHARQDLGLSIDLLVPAVFNEFGERVVGGLARGSQFEALHKDWPVGHGWVTAAVVEMEVTVARRVHVSEVGIRFRKG